MQGKVPEQIQLFRRQVNRFVSFGDSPGHKINDKAAHLNFIRRRLRSRYPPEGSAYACQKLRSAERLGDKIIGPRIQCRDFVRLGIPDGKHDDRHVPILPERFRTLKARLSRAYSYQAIRGPGGRCRTFSSPSSPVLASSTS